MNDVNYYKVLGVNETANSIEIKKAFRKLVRKYHPDVSNDPNADDIIADINNAYEILGDTEKKAEYDASKNSGFSQRFKNTEHHFAESKPGFYWEAIKEKFGENSPFASSSVNFDALFNNFTSQKNAQKTTKNEYDFSKSAESTQYSQFDDLFKSSSKGNRSRGEHQYADINIDLASVFIGDSYTIKLSVPTRQDNGAILNEEKNIKFRVPKGITNNMQIRISEQGSASLTGGKNGDLYLRVKIKPQKNIQIDGSDIYQTINITAWEAALGTEVIAKTPSGNFNIKIPAHSQSGDTLRLVSKGIPSSPVGDLFMVVNLINPTITTPVQNEAFRLLETFFSSTEVTR